MNSYRIPMEIGHVDIIRLLVLCFAVTRRSVFVFAPAPVYCKLEILFVFEQLCLSLNRFVDGFELESSDEMISSMHD